MPSGTGSVCSQIHIPVILPQDVPHHGGAHDDVRGDPRQRVRSTQGVKRRRAGRRADGAPCHSRRQHQAHGDPGHQLRRAGPQHELGPSDALDTVAGDEYAAQEQIHGIIHIQERVAKPDGICRDLVRRQEDMQICIVQRQQQSAAHRRHGDDGHHPQSLQRTPADTVMVARAQVLGGEAGHGRAQGIHRRCRQVGQLVGRAEAHLGGGGHHNAVQHVKLYHHALHDDNADGQHRELQPQGHALHHMAADIAPGDPHVLPVQPQLRILGKGIDEARHRADELSRHRGNGRPGNTPMEGHNEQKVQPDIEDGGKQQEQKRRHRIPHTA